MKPWFEKELTEVDILKFPKPKAKVIRMPNVQSYPDFITGVSDLQAKQKTVQYHKKLTTNYTQI